MNRRMLLAGTAAVFVAAPAFAAPAGGKPIVIGETFELPSAVLGETRRLNVWLPAGYGQGEARFPVLYLLDGGVDEDFHHISGLAAISSAYGLTREFIVVGVESGPRRRALMTFPSTEPDDLKAIPQNGAAATFRTHLAEEVVPWIEANYRASPERVLMGESLAGLFVVETLLRQPELFTGYIAVDPSLWWAKGALVRERTLPGWKAMTPRRRVFVAMSSEGAAAEAAHLTEGLSGVADYTYWPMPAQIHASVYHPAATDALRLIFAPQPGP